MLLICLFVTVSVVLLLALTVGIVFLADHKLAQIIAKLPHDRFETILEFVTSKAESAEYVARFWLISGGMKGLRRKIGELFYIVLALQICVAKKVVPPEEAARVWKLAGGQLTYSVLAVLEEAGIYLGVIPQHVNALTAHRLHWELTTLTLALCQVDNAPDCFMSGDTFL